MTTLFSDLRFAVRLILRAPAFALVAVAMLALGIGANAAIFSVVHAVLLRPLPFPESDRLVRITSDLTRIGGQDVGLDVPTFSELRQSGLFSDVSGLYPANANLTEVSEPERIEAQLVSGSYFRTLGVQAARGRTFGPADEQPGIAPVAVITDSIWQRRFGGDPNVVGRTVRLDNDVYTIIGVLPASFHHPGRAIASEPELFSPGGYAASPFNALGSGQLILSGALARLAPGVSLDTARRRLAEIGERRRADDASAYPEAQGWMPRLIPLQDDVVGKTRASLFLLLSAVAAVLLIACSNVANLLLTRASVRYREFAIRNALGATRARVIRQLLTESLLLAAAGCGLGLVLARPLLRALVTVIPASLPRAAEIAIDGAVFGYAAAVAGLTGVLFGLWPAIQSSLASPQDALKDGGRSGSSGAGRTRLRSILVVAEFAIAVVLLVTATLLVRSFQRLYAVNPGFDVDRLLTAQLWMPLPNDSKTGPYFTHPARVNLLRQSEDRIRVLPGVEQVGWATRLPLSGGRGRQGFLIEGRGIDSTLVNVVEPIFATPGYFEALHIPLVTGRLFTDHDDATTAPALLVNTTFARLFFPREDAVGKRIKPGGPTSTAPWFTIVGVVGDVRMGRLEEEPPAQTYRCAWQTSSISMALVVRASDPAGLGRAVVGAIRSVDPDLPLFKVEPMSSVLASGLAERRFAMLIVTVFAALALILSTIGIYGVLAYLVAQRTMEIGIRIALGAEPRAILRLVVRQGLGLAGGGVALGLVGAVISARAVSGLLYAVGPIDPLTFVIAPALLLSVAAVGCYVPARRAIAIDPIVAMRPE